MIKFVDSWIRGAQAATWKILGHPSSGTLSWFGGQPVASGVNVSEESAMTYSAVWAATRLLSASCAGLPLNLYRKTDTGKELAVDHPLYHVLHRQPNDEMSSFMMRSPLIGQQINRGNAFAEIERGIDGGILGLHPIHASRVNRQKQPDGTVIYKVTTDKGPQADIPSDRMLHVPSIISDDGVTGKGVIHAARESIGFGLATELHGAAYFGNGARPSVLLKHPKTLSPDARTNLRKEWGDMHKGPANAGKPAILAEGMDVATFSLSPEDSQFLQTRQHNVEEVARWSGVPPHMIGHLLRSTFNNIETQSVEFVTYSLLPWLTIWEQSIECQLLTPAEIRDGLFVKHEVDALLRGNAQARSNALKTQFMHGALTLNEWRGIEDRNPLNDEVGDAHFVPANLIRADQTGTFQTEPESNDNEKSRIIIPGDT